VLPAILDAAEFDEIADAVLVIRRRDLLGASERRLGSGELGDLLAVLAEFGNACP